MSRSVNTFAAGMGTPGAKVMVTQYSVLSTQYSVLSTQYSVLGPQYSGSNACFCYRHRRGQAGREQALPAHHRHRPQGAHAASQVRQEALAPANRADAPVDRTGGALVGTLGVRASHAAILAGGAERAMGAQPDRRLR